MGACEFHAGDCCDGRNDCRLVCATLGDRSGATTAVNLIEGGMKDRLLMTGVIGTVVAVICCFTPILVVAFGAIGLSAAVAYLDMILFPALAIFLVITGYALWRHKNAR